MINPKHVQGYKKWHWGAAADRVIDWPDDDLPDELIECGRLLELHVDKLPAIKIRWARRNGSACAFDPTHPFQRLYFLLPAEERQGARRSFYDSRKPTATLNAIAKAAGGRQATSDYPKVQAQPIGRLNAVVYLTEKKGDGLSKYIHHFGEVSGVKPILAVDAMGRLWVCGGNYTVPTPGITD